jgi:hypothetical protein
MSERIKFFDHNNLPPKLYERILKSAKDPNEMQFLFKDVPFQNVRESLESSVTNMLKKQYGLEGLDDILKEGYEKPERFEGLQVNPPKILKSEEKMLKNNAGFYDPDKKIIRSASPEDLNTLLHEAQHAADDADGFQSKPIGAMGKGFKEFLKTTEGHHKYGAYDQLKNLLKGNKLKSIAGLATGLTAGSAMANEDVGSMADIATDFIPGVGTAKMALGAESIGEEVNPIEYQVRDDIAREKARKSVRFGGLKERLSKPVVP